MIAELIGCTGAGKTTHLNKMLEFCREKEILAEKGENFILSRIHLNWIQNYIIRTILIDIISFIYCVLAFRKNSDLYSLILKATHNLPVTVNFIKKLNILRNTFKKIGIYEFLNHYAPSDVIYLVDEGTVNTAHYLFVHLSWQPDFNHYSSYLSQVPLPDIIIYFQEDEEILISRTMVRGHKRIPDRTRLPVERFIKQAVTTFEELIETPRVKSRLLIVDALQKNVKWVGEPINASKDIVLKILTSTVSSIKNTHISI
jgi:thymidylate kinase